MTGDNFVERVHAYSKWLLGLEKVGEEAADVGSFMTHANSSQRIPKGLDDFTQG